MRAAGASLLIAALAAVPAVAAPADPVRGEGLDITGASSIVEGPETGRGLLIAVVDLGFGRAVAIRQQQGELPQPSRLETRSFDGEHGLAGTNAFGNPTAHGEQVAQVVYDYAPGARYVFVNYHTPAEFLAAARWLAERRPDIVVHANNLLGGPFDGTGPAARAVDRVAAGGALWFNSAGNYARQHWRGSWVDENADRVHDQSLAWSFARRKGETITLELSWPEDDGTEPTDLDLTLERSTAAGWTPVRTSRGRQASGAPSSESLTGIVAPVDGTYRARISWAAGPALDQPLTLFSREVALTEIGPTLGGSIPTPADADGAIAVGAVDWRTDALKAYSSRGLTADGRIKPEIVAPTGTAIRTATGRRGVGGTSIAAPNAAGAASVLWWALRRAGVRASAVEVRQELLARARDLGEPGPDTRFGHGLVRLDDDPPHVALDLPRAPVRGRLRVGARIADASPLRSSALSLDGRRVRLQANGSPIRLAWLETADLPDGLHTIEISALDSARNRGVATGSIVVDNTAPALVIESLRVGRQGGARRGLRVALVASDSLSAHLRVSIEVTGGGVSRSRVVRLRSGERRALALGGLPQGRYIVTAAAVDAAGGTTVVRRQVAIRTRADESAAGGTGQPPGP